MTTDVRTSLGALSLAIVVAASVLNLALGALWVIALLTTLLLRRRLRLAPWVILGVALGVGTVGVRFEWFSPPAPRSYAVDEVGWLLERLPPGRTPVSAETRSTMDALESRRAALRARLEARRREELRYTAQDVQRRAAAAVSLSRSLARWRDRAPGEVAALEDAVRRLALTLTSAEFRDVEGRRARLRTWFAELAVRLAAARDESEAEEVARALEPAVMAMVSLRALHEDLARVGTATRVVLRAVGGGEITVTATSALDYDDARGRVVTEERYAFAAPPPFRVVRLETGALRQTVTEPGVAQTLGVETTDGSWRELTGAGEVVLAEGTARVTLVDRRVWAAAVSPVRTILKRIPFGRVTLSPVEDARGEFLIGVVLDGAGGAEALLPIPVPRRELRRITAPARALHDVSLPGTTVTVDGRDVWTRGPVLGGAGDAEPAEDVVIELVPPTTVLRNPAFGRVKPYLYRPNLPAILVLTGLAAFTVLLSRGRRLAAPSPSA